MAEEIAPRLIKLPHVIKEGFIHKEGHNIKKMKKRWFKLLIDLDCNPVLEYYDEIDTDRRLGMCNLSACVMNKPKNLRPPFLHCLRVDLNDHAMNSFVKLVLGWEHEADEVGWINAFKTASALIMAHRKASLHSSSSVDNPSSSSDSRSDLSSPAASAAVPSKVAAAAAAATPQPVPAAAPDASSPAPSSASPSLSGSGKSYQRRGSVTVGNAAAAEKRDQEKAEADAEKRMLIDRACNLSSSLDIEQLISETEQKLNVVSGEERFNPRKQALEEVVTIVKDRLSQIRLVEAEERDAARKLGESCEIELKNFTAQVSLPFDQRSEIQIKLSHYLSQLENSLSDVKSSSSPSSLLVQAYQSCIEAVSSRAKELQDFESQLEIKLNQIKSAKAQLVTTIDLSPVEEILQLKFHYEGMLSKELNPEARGILAEILTACTNKLATEARLDSEASIFVQAGATLKKYARDKVIKKSKHEPASSIVKSVSGTLLWGSHKTGPTIHDVSIGPSPLLSQSGILGSSPNIKLHLHVTVADGASSGGREIIDFASSSEVETLKWVRGLKMSKS